MKLACEMPYFVSTDEHPSPSTAVWKALQSLVMFGCVGPVGLLSCANTRLIERIKVARTLKNDNSTIA